MEAFSNGCEIFVETAMPLSQQTQIEMSIPESERQAPVCPKTVRRHRPNPLSVMGDDRLRCLTKGIRTPSKGLCCCGVHS